MPTNDDRERSINIPTDMANAVLALKHRQDEQRGDWANPRKSHMSEEPWPRQDDPVLEYLLYSFDASVAAGTSVQDAALQLAVHAWFEGGIANYDRGQRDGRAAK